jgi:acyl-CoA synthetase (AMP-forming)/AMP-acid ligase II/NADP-dependent 3-hydroxy acid dehydrogenase YdfG/acyl carrier protein
VINSLGRGSRGAAIRASAASRERRKPDGPVAAHALLGDAKATIRSSLLSNSQVTDAAVVIDHHSDFAIAFVVARSRLPLGEIAAELSDTAFMDVEVRQVCSLPFDADGVLEVDRLLALPVVNSELLRELEARLRRTAPSVTLESMYNPSPAAAPCFPVTTRKSELHGPPLPERPGDPTTLAEVLERAATLHPDVTATFIHQDGVRHAVSYLDLFAEARGIAAGLAAAGLLPGTPVILQADTPYESVLMFWGSVLAGLTPVPLARPKFYEEGDPGATKLLSVVAQFSKSRILAASSATVALRSWLEQQGQDPDSIVDFGDLDHRVTSALPESAPCDVAVYLLTSGSTAAPKLVPQTHERLLDRCAATVIKNRFTPQDVSLNWMPLDHVGGLIMFHLRDVFIGCDQIHVATGWILMQPVRWMELCHEFRVTATWAPNFALNLFNACEAAVRAADWDLARLRFIMNAGESVIASQVITFLRLLEPHGLRPNAVLPAWGMSETCSAVLFNDNFTPDSSRLQGRFVSVGRPLPGISARVVDERNAVLPEGRKGRLQVRGHCVLDGYAFNPLANQQSFTADRWFDTGDLALCENGEIAIVGRDKDVVIVNGQNIACHEIEERLEALPGVTASSAVVVAVRNADDSSDGVVVFLHPDVPETEHPQLVKRVRSTIARGFGLRPSHIVFLSPEDIPRTSIGKVQKEQLKQRYQNQMLTHQTNESIKNSDAELQAWRNVFRRTWLRRTARADQAVSAGALLLVAAEADLEEMATSLRSFAPMIAVAAHGSDLRAALAHVGIEPASLDAVIYIASPSGSFDAPAAGQSLELFRLIKALTRSGLQPKRIFAVDQLTQFVTTAEPDVNLGGSAGIALLRSLAAEMPKLICRHIDVDSESRKALARHLLDELGDPAVEPEVAYRHGQRFVTRLAAEPEPHISESEALAPEGCFLIVGGLGGLGDGLARRLLEDAGRRVVLTGRTAAALLDERRAARLERLRQDAPGRVFYLSMDSTDREGMGEALDAAAAAVGAPIDTIFDLATTFLEKPVKDLSEEEYTSELAAKCRGSWNLFVEGGERGIARLVVFASVNGYFGGGGAAGYSAANRFQEALSDFSERRGGLPAVFHFSWSMWKNVGLSERFIFPELTRLKGFEILDAQRAYDMAFQALGAGRRSLFLGLDPSNPAMAVNLHLEPASSDAVSVSVSESDRPNLKVESIVDQSGVKLPVGEIVTAAAVVDAASSTFAAADETDFEAVIARIWGEVLELDEVPEDESFFDLGGHSLLVPRILGDLKRDLGVDLTVVDLFTYATVIELAEHVRAKQPVSAS